MAKDRYAELYKQFEQEYDLTTINSANDRANLEQFITNLVLIEAWQDEIKRLTKEDATGNIVTIKKLSDAARDTATMNVTLERQLGIDRKSRKKDSGVSVTEYITFLLNEAPNYQNQLLTRVMCPDCNIMVFRFSPVHDHTAFKVAVQCSQCGKIVTAERKERDIFYDLAENDRAWRKQFPVEIKHPRKKKESLLLDDIEPDIIIDDGEIDNAD